MTDSHRQNTKTNTPTRHPWKRHRRFASICVLLHLPCASARLPRSRRALQVNCPEITPYFGLMFEPSYSFFLLLSTPNVPWPCYFLMVSYMWPLYAAPWNSSTRLPILIPRHLGQWPDRWHPKPNEGHHLLFPTSVVSMKLHNIPSSSSRSVSSSAPSRITTSRTSVVNFGFTTFSTPCSYPDHQLSPPHATSLLKTLYQHFDWAVTTFLPGLSGSLSALIKVSQTPGGAPCARKNVCFSAVPCCLVPDVLPFFLAR